MVKWLWGIFLNFYLFFFIWPIFIFAQVFEPEVQLFNNGLDGMWEFSEIIKNHQLPIKPAVFNQPINFTKTEINRGNFLVNNGLLIDFSTTREFLFQFSFNCETEEQLKGFDQPYLVVFYGNELIHQEDDLSLCGKQQSRYFLLPATQKIYLYFGQMGDLEVETTVNIEEIELFTKPITSEKTAISTTLLAQSPISQTLPTTKISPVAHLQTPQPTLIYPSPAIYNFNEKKPPTGEVLGETTEQEQSSFLLLLPDYFPYLVGLLVFLISLPLLILLSDLLSKLRLRKEKNEQT